MCHDIDSMWWCFYYGCSIDCVISSDYLRAFCTRHSISSTCKHNGLKCSVQRPIALNTVYELVWKLFVIWFTVINASFYFFFAIILLRWCTICCSLWKWNRNKRIKTAETSLKCYGDTNPFEWLQTGRIGNCVINLSRRMIKMR